MYYPKRPVKSFQDLEVYQKTLAICVVVVKNTPLPKLSDLAEAKSLPIVEIVNKLHSCILSLPILIATAHSLRFANPQKAIELLEETMLNCNLAVAYLELYRDLRPGPKRPSADVSFFDEQIKNLLTVRMKILHLQRSWKKFFENRPQTQTG